MSTTKKKIVFIINPISGIGKQKTIEKLIEKFLDKNKFESEIAYTQKRGHATEIAAEAMKRNIDIVVAVGGDGSVNEVGKAIVNSSTVLGIIPAGSGNGLARHLGLPMNHAKAIACLNTGTISTIDTININEHFCAGIAGVGLDAHIGWKFSEFGKRGLSSYVKVFLKEFLFYKKNNYSITIDGVNYEREAMLISLANSSQFGNNAYISPMADIRDGLIDVCILKPFAKILTPYLGLRMFNKTLDKSRYMEIIQGKNIQLIQQSEEAHIDGEPLLLGKNITAKINPLSLNVKVPKNNFIQLSNEQE
jgi:diacylglycerol kinase (ATP)